MIPSLVAGMRASAPLGMRVVAPATRKPPALSMKVHSSSRLMAQLKEEHRAHTISQRIRTLKKIPPELIPLGVVLAIALGAAGYSIGMKFVRDRTLRLSRSPGKGGNVPHA